MGVLWLPAGTADPVPGATYPQMDQQGSAVGIVSLRFDAATDEACQWPIRLPGYTSGNVTVTLFWHAETATSNDVVVGASLCAQTPNTDSGDVTGDAWATENTATDTHLGTTAKRAHQVDITVSNLDSLADGDQVFLRIRRVGTSGSDTMTGDMHLTGVLVTWS